MTRAQYDAESVEWCRDLYKSLNEGGVWGVPRTGLLFTKQDGGLVLTDQMPYDPQMPISKKQFDEQQKADFLIIQEFFTQAGISVTKGLKP